MGDSIGSLRPVVFNVDFRSPITDHQSPKVIPLNIPQYKVNPCEYTSDNKKNEVDDLLKNTSRFLCFIYLRKSLKSATFSF